MVKSLGGICAGQLIYFLIRVKPIKADHSI
jgi:hypothetical protein